MITHNICYSSLTNCGAAGCTSTRMNSTFQMATDSTNELLWIADYANDRAVVYNMSAGWNRTVDSVLGQVSATDCPIPFSVYSSLVSSPSGIAVDSSGGVYVCQENWSVFFVLHIIP